MALPLAYTVRNLGVRRASAALTAIGIAMTVAVFAGVLSLRAGFEQLYRPRGDVTVAMYLRPGAASEGESAIRREQADILLKERPEIERDAGGRPLAAAEVFLAVYMEKRDGGLTNTPLRGIQPMSLELQGERLKLAEGRWMEFGADEVVVGRPLTERMAGCQLGEVVTLNMTPFRVVGVFEHDGAEGGEIWGDAERFMAALDRPVFQRVVARVRPDTDFAALKAELEHDTRIPSEVMSEPEYLAAQTQATGGMLEFLAGLLTVIMGAAAILGSINTMMASVAARTHEIGVLRAIGYPRLSIFLTFLLESALMGLLGGALGLLIALPFDGLETGMANFQTFTDVSFAFRLTPLLALKSFGLAFLLGLVGGTLPALRAASLKPVEAFRQL
ncbi:MAG: FtsX-like permease family protein [Planctomycetes bacterium]|nr:FtsX-like permease family protein [Planctomycetota bacterium]